MGSSASKPAWLTSPPTSASPPKADVRSWRVALVTTESLISTASAGRADSFAGAPFVATVVDRQTWLRRRSRHNERRSVGDRREATRLDQRQRLVHLEPAHGAEPTERRIGVDQRIKGFVGPVRARCQRRTVAPTRFSNTFDSAVSLSSHPGERSSGRLVGERQSVDVILGGVDGCSRRSLSDHTA